MDEVWELNDLADVLARRAVWDGLLARTPGASFFQSLDWLEAYWRHFGNRQRLRVLLTARRGEPTGLLPLVLRREPTRVGPVRFLTYPLDHWGSFYGPLGAEPEETLRTALRYLRQARRDWQVLELRWVDAEADGGATERALHAAGFRPHVGRMAPTYVLDLAGSSYAQFLADHTSKWRNNVKRWERRLQELGGVEHLHRRPAGAPGDAAPSWELYDRCEDVAARSWQAESNDGTTLHSPAIRPFLRDVHAAACRVGGAEMHLLTVGGQSAAFAYNYAWRGRVSGLRMGYDPGVSRDGLGHILYLRAIEASFNAGDRLVDLGPGSPDAKRGFFTRAAERRRFSCYAPWSPRAQLIRLKRWRDGRRRLAGA